ncbi:MAG: hypothetical protein HFG75_13625 [Hungatella sp.]|nr:hypothetical protein [Hungatella sp.]
MNRRPYRSSRPYKYHGFLHSDLARLLLFYILPFVTVNGIIFFLVTTRPKYELVIEGTNDYRTTDITFTIKSVMPLKEVTIKMDSEPLDLEKVGKKKYRATITHNGSLEIYMKNFNDMALLDYEYIDILDNESPIIEDAVSEEGVLSFTVSDTQSGVDFTSICGITSTGEQILPLSADRTTGRVSFPIDSNGLIVQVKDMTGNEFQTTFSLNSSEDPAAPESSAAEGV